MQDERKTKAQLVRELRTLRAKLKRLEKSEEKRRRLVDELCESEEQYRSLIEAAPDVVYTISAEDGSLTSLNPAFERLTGWSRAEWLGKPFMGIVHPDDVSEAVETFQKALRGERLPLYQLRILSKSGEYLVGEFTTTPFVKNGKVVGELGIGRDITERKRAEEEFALLAHTIRSIGECVSVTDPENKILFVNDAFLRTYGYTRDELIGKPISIVRSPTTEPATDEILHATLQGDWQGELVNRKKDQTEFSIALSTSVVRNEKGQPIALVGIAAEITERKQAEQERESLINELKTALENVRTLGGLVPICAHCKKIRDDKGYWNQLEKYILEHTDAKLTHGICPDCAKLYFPGIATKTSPGGAL
ncbi:MAG: PAS domain S-box protein [Ignavibacteria bacterium]|nr:PAS domain S-box protein [Ignavibacteria bacterium]